jgi:hypothetical protein
MRRGNVISAAFLTGTALLVGWELVAAFDGSDDTRPWTDLIVSYVPQPLGVGAAVVLSVWLPIHLVIYYRKKRHPTTTPEGASPMLPSVIVGAVRTALQVAWSYGAAWLIVHHIPVPAEVPAAVQLAVLAFLAGAFTLVVQWLERRTGDSVLARVARGLAKVLMLWARPARYPKPVEPPVEVTPLRR